MKYWQVAWVLLAMVLGAESSALGAVGCDLNDPDRDVARLFPGSTGYKTVYVSIDRGGGEQLLREIEDRLGDRFQGLFETIDVPYTVYEIYRGSEKIGYIHGVNQKGTYGGIQVFLAVDLEGNIRAFYFQKLTSQYGKQLRDKAFGNQFVGLNLRDFASYDVARGAVKGEGKVAAIRNPAPQAEPDFRAALRAAKKNLILIDEFLLGDRYLES